MKLVHVLISVVFVSCVLTVSCSANHLKENDSEEDFFAFNRTDLEAPEQAKSKKRGLDNSTMGVKFPIWFAACRYREIRTKFTSPGRTNLDSAWVKLESLSVMNSAAMKADSQLQKLPDHIVKYLQNFHSHQLDIPVQDQHMCPTNTCSQAGPDLLACCSHFKKQESSRHQLNLNTFNNCCIIFHIQEHR